MMRVKSFDQFVKLFESDDAISQVKSKIRRVIIWLNINKGFYAELLSNLEISGSSELDPPTMCTNGSEIKFHPEFILNQSEEAIRLVLSHEILHCIGDHCNPNRMGPRNPDGWNIACDYAINPILKSESGFSFPVDENGERMGLYDEKYDGWRPEEIYDDLIDKGVLDPKGNPLDPYILKKSDFGEIFPEGKEIPGDVDGDLADITGTGGKNGAGEKNTGEENTVNTVSVGDRVRTDDGTIGVVKKVNPDGSIII